MPGRTASFVLTREQAGEKLVDVVKRHLIVLPVPAIGPLLEAGGLLLDGEPIQGSRAINQRVVDGRELSIAPGGLDPVAHRLVVPHDRPVEVVHRDDALIVVDKPAGWNVHPLGRHRDETLVGRLAWMAGARTADELADWQPWGSWRGHPLHRLDRPTTGLIAFTTSANLHTQMREQLEGKRIRRGYQAIVLGRPAQDEGTIEAPIGRDPEAPRHMAVVPLDHGGRVARTHWRVVERHQDTSIVDLELDTGRTHQIRVHMASLGHPLVGDDAYGGILPDPAPNWWAPGRIGLHANRLDLRHPEDDRLLQLTSKTPW